jgi:hypothetical protein
MILDQTFAGVSCINRPVISSCIQFRYVCVVPRYLYFVIYWKYLFSTFILRFCPTFFWKYRNMLLHLLDSYRADLNQNIADLNVNEIHENASVCSNKSSQHTCIDTHAHTQRAVRVCSRVLKNIFHFKTLHDTGAQFSFKKSGRQQKILGAWRATWIKFYTDDSQTFGITEQNLVPMETGFVHPRRTAD